MSARGRYLDGPFGQVHLREAGSGPAVVLLHQVPRSADEFTGVLPLLAARGLRAVAVDLPGFGASSPAPTESIEAYADGVEAVLDDLGVPLFLVGHHTGGVVAVELAARRADAVAGLVLSSTPLVDPEHRARPAHGVDEVEPDPSGGHLQQLWAGRQGFYPEGRPDLLERFVRDALTAGPERSAAGHAAVRVYRMEERLPRLTMPMLLLTGSADPYASPQLSRMAAALPSAGVLTIDGGTVPLPDHLPAEFAAVVGDFVLSTAGATP